MRCVRNDKCRPTFVVALFIVCSISLSVFNFDNLAFVEAKTVPIPRLILTKIPQPSISVVSSLTLLHSQLEAGLHEMVSWNTEQQFIKYSIGDETLNTTILDDFDQNVTVYKVQRGDEVACYVGELTRADDSDMRTDLFASHDAILEIKARRAENRTLSGGDQFLSTQGRVLCKRSPLYTLDGADEALLSASEMYTYSNNTWRRPSGRARRAAGGVHRCAPQTYWYTYLNGYCWLFCGCDIRWTKRANPSDDYIHVFVYSGDACSWPGTICVIRKWGRQTSFAQCGLELIQIEVSQKCMG